MIIATDVTHGTVVTLLEIDPVRFTLMGTAENEGTNDTVGIETLIFVFVAATFKPELQFPAIGTIEVERDSVTLDATV